MWCLRGLLNNTRAPLCGVRGGSTLLTMSNSEPRSAMPKSSHRAHTIGWAGFPHESFIHWIWTTGLLDGFPWANNPTTRTPFHSFCGGVNSGRPQRDATDNAESNCLSPLIGPPGWDSRQKTNSSRVCWENRLGAILCLKLRRAEAYCPLVLGCNANKGIAATTDLLISISESMEIACCNGSFPVSAADVCCTAAKLGIHARTVLLPVAWPLAWLQPTRGSALATGPQALALLAVLCVCPTCTGLCMLLAVHSTSSWLGPGWVTGLKQLW